MSERKLFSKGLRVLCPVLLILSLMQIAGCMSIHTAAEQGNVSAVRSQLAWGENPDARTLLSRDTPLIKAAANGHIEVVKLLLEQGADVNRHNEGGETPLHYAARNGHVEVMEILLDHGADVTAKGTGCGTPLQWAARSGQIKAAELLLAHDADVNQKGTDEHTALTDAVRNGHVDMVKFLLSRGAEVNTRASYGCTPLYEAYRANNIEIGRILLEHGADPDLECNGRPVPEGFLRSLPQPSSTVSGASSGKS